MGVDQTNHPFAPGLPPGREVLKRQHLELREEVRRLGEVEGARAHEEDVVGLHVAELGRDGRALDEREEVPLHAWLMVQVQDLDPGSVEPLW